MLKPEDVPENVWCEVALRLEAYRVPVTDQIAKVVAAEAINAWPGIYTDDETMYGKVIGKTIFLPLPQEARDE